MFSLRWPVSAAILLTSILTAHGFVLTWDFENGDLAESAGGVPLLYLDGPAGSTVAGTQFGTTTQLGVPDIDGRVAHVMKFPACTPTMGYLLTSQPAPDTAAPGPFIDRYTLMYDIYYPTESGNHWRSLIQLDVPYSYDVSTPSIPMVGTLGTDNDGDLFVRYDNAVGIDGKYSGYVEPGSWHRIGFVFDLPGGAMPAGKLSKYIDGDLVATQDLPVSYGVNRFSLRPIAVLFTDNDGETAVGYVNSIQVRDVALSDQDMARFAGPQPGGIPVTIPPLPSRITNELPAANQSAVRPDTGIEATIQKGETTIAAESIHFYLDGTEMPATADVTGNSIRVIHSHTNLFASGSQHTARISYTDSRDGARNFQWKFTVAAYQAVTLPPALYFEDFNSTAQGALPAGWSERNFSEHGAAIRDFSDPGSAAWDGLTVVSNQTPENTFGLGGMTQSLRPTVENGRWLTNLSSGNWVYGASAYRSYKAIQFLFSPDFDLSGGSEVVLSFHSIYQQAPNSMGALEYSVDGGVSWKPVVYLLDPSVVVTDDSGKVKAVETFMAELPDVPSYVDPVSGQPVGGHFGAFIGSPISQDLAPFVSARATADPLDSNRVEVFRLAGADGQRRVRFRFTHVGNNSWYWGIDNFGLYGTRASLLRIAPGSVISWEGGESLQSAPEVRGPWQTLSGARSPYTNAVPGARMFFSLVK